MENKIKKSWFNLGLYLDGLRQLKIIGIMSAVIMGLSAILVPYGENLANANYKAYYSATANQTSFFIGKTVQYSLLELNPFIVLAFLVVVPLMTLYLFNYLNRRNACDFYHAIPCTREGLFVTYGAGILTWNIGLILESFIISIVAAGVFKYVELQWYTVPVTILNMIAGCILTFGVVAIAMSITGTVFTNVIVSAMILCVPRIFVSVIVYIITSEITVMPFTFGSSILNDRLNTVTNLVTGFVIRGEYDAVTSYASFAYTLIVGIIYCVIALILMKRRKSEAATSAAISTRLQCFFRLIPAMLICLIPVSYIFDGLIGRRDFDKQDIFFIAVFFIIALVAYFVYELMTTRKLKNLIKAVPGLLWLAAYNIVVIIVLMAGYNILLNDIPDVSDISSVKISYNRYYNDAYYDNLLKDVEFTSDEVKELLVSELSRDVEAIKAGNSLYNEQELVTGNTIRRNVVDVSDYRVVCAEFRCGGQNKSRYIYLTQSAAEELYNLICNNEQVNEKFIKKIDKDDISNAYIARTSGFTMDDAYSLYETYMDELAGYDFSLTFSILHGGYYNDDTTNYDSIVMHLKNGQYISLPVSDYMPETLNKYFEMTAKSQAAPMDEFIKKIDEIKKIRGEDYQYLSGDVYLYIACVSLKNRPYASANVGYSLYDGNIDISDDYTDNGEKVLRQIAEKLEKASGKIDLSLDKPVIYVEYSVNQNGKTADGEDTNQNEDDGMYYQVDEETIELIKTYSGN